MPRYKVTLEYDGTAFAGWQKQKNAKGLQNLLEDRLAVLFRQPIQVAGASRTDAGVHARGQVIAFNAPEGKTTERIQKAMNGLLPQSVRARKVEEAPDIFDPRRDPISKTYRYTWYNAPAASPFWRHVTWHIEQPLDVEAMRQAAALIVGEHDFSSFRAAGCAAKSPIRKILSVEIKKKGERVQMSITGQAFLQQMIRILAGTLADVGQGKLTPGKFKGVLEAKDRKKAGKTAPPHGLCLWEISYGEIPRPGRKLLKNKPQIEDAGDEEDPGNA